MVTGGAVRGDGAVAVGVVAADAPPAIAKDIPAAPQTGKVIVGCFRFEAFFVRAMVEPPVGLADARWVSRHASTLGSP